MNRFIEHAKVQYPIICGAMYPCSNPELVAAASEAGALGIVQPLSLVYVHGYNFREGLRKIRTLTKKPIGLNLIVEKSAPAYEKRSKEWLKIALDEGIRFFITALGNPLWVVEAAHAVGGVVYHDATSAYWAEKAIDKGIDGLICVNNRAGGHAGQKSPLELYEELHKFNVPLICAGGIGDEKAYVEALKIGYDGVQMGTRFIATIECSEKENYKQAIVHATAEDIVLTERVTGIPLAVIRTPYVEKIGTKIGPIARALFRNRWTKPWMRTFYAVKAIRQFKRITLKGGSSKDYWQAGRSVAGIHRVEPVADIIARFAREAAQKETYCG